VCRYAQEEGIPLGELGGLSGTSYMCMYSTIHMYEYICIHIHIQTYILRLACAGRARRRNSYLRAGRPSSALAKEVAGEGRGEEGGEGQRGGEGEGGKREGEREREGEGGRVGGGAGRGRRGEKGSVGRVGEGGAFGWCEGGRGERGGRVGRGGRGEEWEEGKGNGVLG